MIPKTSNLGECHKTKGYCPIYQVLAYHVLTSCKTLDGKVVLTESPPFDDGKTRDDAFFVLESSPLLCASLLRLTYASPPLTTSKRKIENCKK